MSHEQDMQRVVRFFETLTVASLGHLPAIYAADAYFKDPFNEVCGLGKIEDIFYDMFDRVEAPRFVIDTHVMQGNDAFLAWRFQFCMKRFAPGDQSIRGATHLCFDDSGLVVYHRDYWDAAEELYEKLPVLGRLMRFLRRSGAAPVHER